MGLGFEGRPCEGHPAGDDGEGAWGSKKKILWELGLFWEKMEKYLTNKLFFVVFGISFSEDVFGVVPLVGRCCAFDAWLFL